MASRRNKKTRRRRTARGRRAPEFLYAVVSTAAILAVIVVSVTLFFKITDITVTGESRYSDDEIIKSSGISVGENMFMINKFAALRQIIDGHPYLDGVQMKRRLPGTIEIIINGECEPSAAIESGDKVWLCDKNGKLLEEIPTSALPEGTVLVSGVEPYMPQAGKQLETEEKDKEKPLFDILLSADENGIIKKIESIDMSRLYQITMRYGERFSVKIGTADELERKMRFLVSVEERLDQGEKGTLDITDASIVRFVPD